jgi:outer membrane protein assembly factor BamA
MKTKLGLGVLCILCSLAVAQESAKATWTDKNNAQESAAYMLRVSYYERGYMGAQVVVEQQSTNDVFLVRRGPIYHFRELAVTGIENLNARMLLKDAPKPGEVYSASRVNDWIADVKKQMLAEHRAEKVTWGVTFDHPGAAATLNVSFE